jgi:hypothetical protein
MFTPNFKLFDDLVEISKSDIKFIDLLRPFFVEKYKIDIHDLLFEKIINMDTNSYPDTPIEINNTPSPNYYPSSPSDDTIIDDDTPFLMMSGIFLLHRILLLILLFEI